MSDILTIKRPDHFDLDKIFDCGQSFRFEKNGDGFFEGVAFGRLLRIGQDEKNLYIEAAEDEYENIWKRYLALDEDYGKINEDILKHFECDVIKRAMEAGDGIRILRQDPWETLCSFIISQNNNIPRIKSLVSAVCRAYGQSFESGGKVYYAFPGEKEILNAGEAGLKALKTGFRAGYLISAAEHCLSDTDLCRIRDEYTYEQGLEELCRIKGVGPKVASCTLLFALGKWSAFPVDVWIKRTIDKYFGGRLDITSLGRYAGIAQQYLFYYERTLQ
ncbi:MAG: DNA-3-methyladenine glycosylase 2 family protein [Clostridia bacterium]|nr:DNA-3-methyladenine glycosylase 2 family protein [Clostridia bacterium]